MKRSAIVMVLFLASLEPLCSANTRGFDVQTEVSIDGKLVSVPHIVARPNELTSIQERDAGNRDLTIDVLAFDYPTDKTKDGIRLEFTVSFKDGAKRTVISRPQFVIPSGKDAELSVGHDGKPQALKMKVRATRLQ